MFNNYVGKLTDNKKKALLLILLFGIISFLGDIIYEGARSVNGPYLKTLGANAANVGIVVGIGELLGYAIRLFSGYFSDKKNAAWFFTILGYSLLISVPLLSFSNFWQLAAMFIVIERIGKGLRSPAKDTLLSYATKQVGTGIGFGISEFLDQLGATLGPLIFMIFFLTTGNSQKTLIDYQNGYSLLWIPFVLLLIVVLFAYFKVKTPETLESSKNEPTGFTKVFWLYSLFTFITTFGFINFAIIGFHIKAKAILPDSQIPLLYTIAMVIDAIFALIVGKIYDKYKALHHDEQGGLLILVFIPIVTIFILPLAFSKHLVLIITSMVFWGIVMGTHETIMKAAIADITSINKRGTGYGIFNLIYGLALFGGSLVAGYLYEISIPLLISIFIFIEILSVPFFFLLKKEIKR